MAAKRISRGRPTPMRSMTRPGRNICSCAPTRRAVCRALGAQRRVPALVQPRARHGLAPHPRHLQDRRGPAATPRRPVTQPFRLPVGGTIDRGRVLNFRFDGRAYEGHPGDTLASALLANGVRLVARSFKYHRPRGIFSAGAEEPSALVQLETGAHTEPNRRPTEILLYDGLSAASQHAWPSLGADLGAIVGGLGPLVPAGFYYKTFMQPRALWASALGAAAAPDGRARPGAGAARSVALRQAPHPLRRAGGRRRTLRPRRRARRRTQRRPGDPGRQRQGVRRRPLAPLLPDRRRRRHGMGATVVAELAALPETAAARDHGHRPLRRQLPDRRRAGRRAARPRRAGRPAAPASLAHPRAAGGAGDRGPGAPAGFPRQRPPRHHAGERRRDLPAPLCGDARPARGAVRR